MKAVVLFPGIGYTADRPLLYYARKLAERQGYDRTVSVQYVYRGGNIRGNQEKMREAFAELYRQAEAALSEISWEDCSGILFISKSIGTVIAAAYAQSHGIKAKHLLYTPLAETFRFAGAFQAAEPSRSAEPSGSADYSRSAEPSGSTESSRSEQSDSAGTIAFLGTKDPWSDVNEVQRACEHLSVPLKLIEDANHSLETGDPVRDIRILEAVMEETQKFLQ